MCACGGGYKTCYSVLGKREVGRQRNAAKNKEATTYIPQGSADNTLNFWNSYDSFFIKHFLLAVCFSVSLTDCDWTQEYKN